MMNKVTLKFVLDNRPLSSGDYRVLLRATKSNKQKKISLDFKCKKEHFINEQFTKSHENHVVENEILLNQKSRALKIIREFQVSNSDFTLDDFEVKFRGKPKSQIDFISFTDELIDEMERSGRMGNARAYRATKNSVVNFFGSKLKFNEITPEFLDKYEVFLRENGNSNGGIAFKMREVRAIYNKADKRGYISNSQNPFSVYKISKLKSKPKKKALSIEEFKKLREFDISSHPELIDTYYFFMFSILTRGMNFQDMMLLKWSDISAGRINYTRSKTKKSFSIEIMEEVQEILDYYKSEGTESEYVFPILLRDNLTPKQIQNRKDKVLTRYNKRLKILAKLVGINKSISSYTARHSYATILKYRGVSISKISELLGHGDVSITEAYLKEFDQEELDIESRKILDV